MAIRVLLIVFVFLACPLAAQASTYVVQPGDTLTSIASREQVSVATLASENGLSNPNLIRIGTSLIVPGTAVAETAPMTAYRVQPGDTLSGLSLRFGLSIASLRALNPVLGAYPLIGQWLRVCQVCTSAAGSSATSAVSGAAASNVYVVQPGDTLIGIAIHYGTTVSALLGANSLSNPNLIFVGRRLAVPSYAASGASAAPVQDVPGLITAYSQTYGVEPALALGISWQESGFNQSVVSPTGAIGVMQVEPYTGDIISSMLGRPLNLSLLHDNVQAGVYWLSYLLRYYGGDSSAAVAAYYQGTNSIAIHGLFDDTVQYVGNVLALRTRFGG